MAEPTDRRQVRPPSYGFAYRVAVDGPAILYRIFGLHMHGRGHVPARGPAVIFANHESYLDPLLLIQLTIRPIMFVAKEELFEVWNGWLFPRLNCVPVRRGSADIGVFRAAARHLRSGGLLGLFPEGTRSPDGVLRPAQHGALAIALNSGVPIIPIGLAGTREILPTAGGWTPGPVAAEIGSPLVFSNAIRRRRLTPAQLDRVGVRVMDEIARLRRIARSQLGVTE